MRVALDIDHLHICTERLCVRYARRVSCVLLFGLRAMLTFSQQSRLVSERDLNLTLSILLKHPTRHGNQLNYITTAWTCGYVIGQIPSKYACTINRQ